MKHYRSKMTGRHQYYIGILNKFQWFGIMLSTDNPITLNKYFLFEFRFLCIRIWYTYDFKN